MKLRTKMKLGFLLALALAAAVTSGCQSQPVKPADASVMVQSWKSEDGNQVILRVPGKQRTDYFDNDARRVCFHFSAGGMWNPTPERGLLVSENGRDQVGVLMLSSEDLENYEGSDLVAKAISLHISDNNRRLGASPSHSETEEIRSFSGKLTQWTGEWKVSHQGQDLLAVVVRWLVPVEENWVAIVTASPGSGGDAMAMEIIRSLEVSHSPGCYRSRVEPVLSAPCVECEI